MAKIEIKSQSGAKTYDVLDDLVTIGSDAKNHIRLKEPGAPAFAARLVRSAQGWRLEAAEAGRKFTLNGLTVGAADLEPGDVVKIDAIEITFHGDDEAQEAAPAQPATAAVKPVSASRASGPAPAQRSSVQRSSAQRSSAGRGAGERGRDRGARDDQEQRGGRGGHGPKRAVSNQIGLYSIIGLISLAAVFLVYRFTQSDVFANDPSEVLKEARRFLKNGDVKGAEDIMRVLDTRNPDAITKAEMEKVRTQLAALKQKSQFQEHLSRASNEQTILISFVQSYLTKEPFKREHCREFVRLASLWLEKFKELPDLFPEFAENQYQQVKDWVTKFRPIAKPEEPDTFDDVNFRADRLTRLTPNKRWREATQALDDFLVRNPGNEAATAMRRSRLNQAENWLSDKLQIADNLIAKKDFDVMKEYVELFEFQIETGGLPAWRSKLEAKIGQLKAALPKKE